MFACDFIIGFLLRENGSTVTNPVSVSAGRRGTWKRLSKYLLDGSIKQSFALLCLNCFGHGAGDTWHPPGVLGVGDLRAKRLACVFVLRPIPPLDSPAAVGHEI